MWQLFTDRARRAVAEAQGRAKEWGDPFVEPSHLLLALASNPECSGARVLVELGLAPEAVADFVVHRMPHQTGYMSVPDSLSSTAQKVVDLTYEEARRLDDEFVGTEHLLLGIIRLDDGPTGEAFRTYNVSLALARAAVANLHESDNSVQPPAAGLLRRLKAFFRRIVS